MTPPPATPKKRQRRQFTEERIPRHSPTTPPRLDWSSSLDYLLNNIRSSWTDLPDAPLGPAQIQSPELVFNGYFTLYYVLRDAVMSTDRMCRKLSAELNIPYDPPYIRIPYTNEAPIPPPPVEEEPAPAPDLT
ncbi:hypothetical protein RSOL_287930, partial [Rhizoctonia solani AG-3 Rhs1AP]